MKLLRYGTITCPDCGGAVLMRIWFERIGQFRCAACGLGGFGPVKYVRETEVQDGDVEVRIKGDKP